MHLFTLTNAHGLIAKVTNCGIIITGLRVPDRLGRLGDVVLGRQPNPVPRGPDDALYLSVFGFGFPPGAGEVVRIALHRDDHHGWDDDDR